MKTKYILHGGFTHHVNPDNEAFIREALKDAPAHSKILLVYFAVEPELYESNETKDKLNFERYGDGKTVECQIATQDKFEDQVKWADVVYMAGGTTIKLLEVLRKFPGFRYWLDGKTIAAESAGAYALSVWFYSKSGGGLLEGLGIVPVKLICHYEGKNADKLDGVGEGMEKLLLANYKFKVFQV